MPKTLVPAREAAHSSRPGRAPRARRRNYFGREDAVRGLECGMCHGHELRTGSRVLNLRGLWLLGRKRKLDAPRVDPAWLTDYREPVPARPRPSPTPPAKPR
jgi:hypothetical protein